MSYTTIYALWPGCRHEELEELRNAHGSAPVVWNEMFKRYIGGRDFEYSFNDAELWPLWKRLDIPAQFRAVLLMTYDNSYVSRENYARAAADIREFLACFSFCHGRVNHWPRLAEIFESSPDCPAIGFNWTSVCSDPFQGEYDEEIEDYRPFDWTPTWEVYEQLGAPGESNDH